MRCTAIGCDLIHEIVILGWYTAGTSRVKKSLHMKFVVIYRVPLETMQKWRKETAPEEITKQTKEMGEKMMAWVKKNEKAIVDKGMPLGKNTRMTKEGATAMTNDLNYMCVVEAENVDAVVAMFKDNPHFDIPTSFLDIMEVPNIGM